MNKILTVLMMTLTTSLTAQAGCEDGPDTAEFEARRALAEKVGTRAKQCKGIWLAHHDVDGGEVHYVDVLCGQEQAVVKVALKEIEDAMCSLAGTKLAAPKPRELSKMFPRETTDFEGQKRFRKIFQVDAERIARARHPSKIYAELVNLAFGRDWTIQDMAQYDGHFTQWLDTVTGLQFWQVSHYPGDNESGALIEVWANHVRKNTDLRVIAGIGDSWIEWNDR